MGQHYINKIQKSYSYKNAAGYCPFCNNTQPFGDISCTVELTNMDHNALAAINIDTTEVLFDSIDGTINDNRSKLISIRCPECDKPMVFVDKYMAGIIKTFNTLGIYTRYSCDGLDDVLPYFMFYSDSFKIFVMLLTATLADDVTIEVINGSEYQSSPIMLFNDQTHGSNELAALLTQHHLDLAMCAIYPNTEPVYNDHPVTMSSEVNGHFMKLMSMIEKDLKNMIVTWFNLTQDKNRNYRYRYPYERRIAKEFNLMLTTKKAPSLWNMCHNMDSEKCSSLARIYKMLNSVDLSKPKWT